MPATIVPLLVAVIGFAVGIAMRRFTGSFLARLKLTGSSPLTSGLVGVAGAFLGYHLVAAVAPAITPAMLLVAAALGAVLVVWIWRGR